MLTIGLALVLVFETLITLLYKSNQENGHVFWTTKERNHIESSSNINITNHETSNEIQVIAHPKFSKRFRLALRFCLILSVLLIGALIPKEWDISYLLGLLALVFFVETHIEDYGQGIIKKKSKSD